MLFKLLIPLIFKLLFGQELFLFDVISRHFIEHRAVSIGSKPVIKLTSGPVELALLSLVEVLYVVLFSYPFECVADCQ